MFLRSYPHMPWSDHSNCYNACINLTVSSALTQHSFHSVWPMLIHGFLVYTTSSLYRQAYWHSLPCWLHGVCGTRPLPRPLPWQISVSLHPSAETMEKKTIIKQDSQSMEKNITYLYRTTNYTQHTMYLLVLYFKHELKTK